MPKGNLTGLISAVPFEASLLIKELRSRKKLSPSIVSGRIGKRSVVHIASGMGVANAAHAATVLMERFSPARVVVFGIGGAYPGCGLKISDVVIAEKEFYADTGVLLKDGLHGVNAIGIELLRKGSKKYFNEFPLDSKLLKKALRESGGIKSGVFATVNATTGTLKRAKEIKTRFGAVCENMEGAAVVHVCARYGVPVLELRGISNLIPKRDGWDKEGAARNSQEALLRVLPNL
jgi:futalosine hydrolase